MAKKFLSGMLIGGFTATAAWRSLDPQKKAQFKEWLQEKSLDVKDWATDYALHVLDATDNLMANHPEWADRVNDWSKFAKHEGDHIADHFMSDDFDEQTADLRDSLAREKSKDGQNDDDDIIIDKTDN